MNLFDLPIEELKKYKPELTRRTDFHSFWESRIVENKKYPLNIEVKERSYPLKEIKVYDVYFDGFRNSRIHGVYISPAKDHVEKPAAVIFHGYNWNTLQPHYAFKHVIQGTPVLMVETRGQSIESPDENSYGNGGSAGWMTSGILDPDCYYYTYVYMDCFRSVGVVKELSGKSKVYVEGGSQGGALAIAVAALKPDILFALCDIPFLSHFERSIKLASEGPYNEIYHLFKVHDPLHQKAETIYGTLSYVDCMNLAGGVACPVLLSVGLEDTVCPPSGGFAVFNHLQGPKDIRVYPEYGHEVPSIHEEEKLQFIAAHTS
ncbi:acetylxylan esterase [Bacillus sp. ISL-45]|uniref:acetylxylan esterase n=1 Tax=Bacillus sp. ISL-45 TaxID=2819128 RepID=UPI001BEBE714|nr:acetylxylan esterase [Bacillus sp. ISL-45]MBT2661616.1 acetylxylan esterase [Bacillus sp. ISL-45]